jgi:hypothetical protein
MYPFLRRAVLGFALFTIVPAAAYAQASITGVVRDSSNAVLPGVTVEAASPALIEKVRTAVTDGGGQYRIENLRPGAYTVTFTLPGFSTVKREGIQLTGEFVASVNADLRVGGLEETITVSGDAPLVDVQSATRQSVMDREILDVLPSAGGNLSNVAALIPGVVASGVDVGGLSGVGRGASVSAHGVVNMQQQFNGLSLSAANGGASGAVTNMGAYQEMTIDTGGAGAENREGGVRLQFIPRDGGNRTSGSMALSFANSSMQSNNFSDELKSMGLGTPNELDKIWDVNPEIGGPIKQDTLWYHWTYRYTGVANHVPMFFNKNAGDPTKWTYEPDSSRPAGSQDIWNTMNARLTWQATPKHKFGVAMDYAVEQTKPRALTATISPEASAPDYARLAPKRYFMGDWTSPVTNRVLIESVWLRQDEYASRPATGNNPFLPVGSRLNGVLEQSNNLRYRASVGGGTNGGRTLSRTVFGRGTASYITGTHAVKIGFNYGSGSQRQNRRSIDAPIDYRFNNGVPNQLTLQATPIDVNTDIEADHGLFAQDRWTWTRATMTLGLRYDYLHMSFPETFLGPGDLFPTRSVTLPKAEGVHWNDVSPRLGVAYDLFGDGKTAVKVSMNKYLEPQYAGTGNFGRNLAPASSIVASTNRAWADANGNFVPECDLLNPVANGECGAMSNSAFGTLRQTLTFDPEVIRGWGTRYFNWQFSAGVQRELMQGVSIDVGYYRTWFGNFTLTDDRSIGPNDFDPYSLKAPTDSRLPDGGGYTVAGLYDIKPARFGTPADNFVTFSKNFGKQYLHWNGVDVAVNARPSANMLMSGGISTGRQTSDNCDVAAKVPEMQFASNVWTPLQFCHQQEAFQTQVKFTGAYTVPRLGVRLSGSLQNGPGPAITASYVAPLAEVQPSLGRPLAGNARNVTAHIVSPGTLYGDRYTQVDLRVAKIFRAGTVRVTPQLDIYNLLNSNVITALSSAYATWQRPQGIMPPRFVKVGLQLNF